MKAVIDAAIKFETVHDCWPNNVISDVLRLKSKDDEYWEGERQGRYTREQVDRWLADGEHERLLAEHTIQRGALQVIASALVGQNTQERAGESEFFEGLRRWSENREERLRELRKAERAAAHGVVTAKKRKPKRPRDSPVVL